MPWLSLLIFLPLVGGLLSWGLWRHSRVLRWAFLAVALAELALNAGLYFTTPTHTGFWLSERVTWLPAYGIQYLLALDGISLLLTGLTAAISVIALGVAWCRLGEGWPLFGLLVLATESALMGVFLALDLVLFYVFWELMLVPIFLLVALFGSEGSLRAAFKFVLFTLTGSLLMLVSILVLYLGQGSQTGYYSFSYFSLLNNTVPKTTALWLMLGFLAAFAVKLPLVPLHLWAPDTYSKAPPAVTILLAGAMANAGAYGILRFCLPLFPQAVAEFAPLGMALGAVAVVYAGLLVLAQQDLKAAAAYASISHMGLVVLGLFAWQEQSLNGAVFLLLAHGLLVAGLFAVIEMLEARGTGTVLAELGGLFRPMPRLGALFLVFALSGLGLPGLANFPGEILVLAGSFQVSRPWAILATLGIIISVSYFLKVYEQVMLGPLQREWRLVDLNPRELLILGVLTVAVLGLGLYPDLFLHPVRTPLNGLIELQSTTGGASHVTS